MDFSKKSIIVVSQQPYMYKDDELLQKLTVRSHIFNKIRYDEVKSRHRHDKCFNLASTLSANVIRQLLNNERMLQTKISKMPNFNQNIFAQFSDETVIDTRISEGFWREAVCCNQWQSEVRQRWLGIWSEKLSYVTLSKFE